VRWNLGKLDVTKKPQFTGQFQMDPLKSGSTDIAEDITSGTSRSEPPPTVDVATAPNLSVSWKIPLASVSGLSVSGLSVTGESYRPYKGVRNITKSGKFQIRTESNY